MDLWYYILYIALVVTPLVFIFYKYMTSEYSYWKNRNVPYILPTFPYGNIQDQVMNRVDIGHCFKALYDQMPEEGYFGIFELGTPALVLKDINLIKSVMVSDFHSFADRGHIHKDVKNDYLAALHLFNLKNEAWKKMRSKILPTFTTGRMKAMFQFMQICSQRLDNYLDNAANNGDIIEFKDLISRFTSDAISSCLFGLETNAIDEKESEVRKISRLMFPTSLWSMIKLMLSINQPFLYDLLGLEINHANVKQFCMQVAKDTYNYRLKNNIYRNDFVDLLIKIKQNKNLHEDEKKENVGQRNQNGIDDGLTFKEMAAQIFVMFAAGFETSSTTTTMALYEMSLQPEILIKATKEVDTVLQKHANEMTYDALKEMVYLEQIMYETLRLYPSLPILTRKNTQPYKVPNSNLVLEKGTRVIIPSFAINQDSNYYPEPQRFDPERFSPENNKNNSVTNLQFGDGPMACIGVRFGKMQVKCALVTILSKYKISSTPQTPKKITLNPCQFLPTPMEPILLKVSRRKDK